MAKTVEYKLSNGLTLELLDDDYLVYFDDAKIEQGTLADDTQIPVGDSSVVLKGGEMVQFFISGSLYGGTLAQDASVGGATFEANTEMIFYESGRIFSATLVEDFEYNGFIFMGGYFISFYESGAVADGTLAMDYTFSEIGGMTVSAGNYVSLYESGKLKSMFLVDDKTVDSVEYRGNHDIAFYESGLVSAGYLAKDTPISEVVYAKDCEIRFFDNGGVERGVLRYETELDGQTFAENSEIRYFLSGRVLQGTLAFDQTIGEVEWKGDTRMVFYPSGGIREATPLKNCVIDGITYSAGEGSFTLSETFYIREQNQRLYFYENGKVLYGTLAKPTQLNGIILSPDKPVRFYSNGNLWYATLHQEVVINGVEYQAESDIFFYDDGALFSATLARESELKNIDEIVLAEEDTVVFWDRQGNLIGIKLDKDFEAVVDGKQTLIPSGFIVSMKDYQGKVVDSFGLWTKELGDFISFETWGLVWVRYSDFERGVFKPCFMRHDNGKFRYNRTDYEYHSGVWVEIKEDQTVVS